MKKFLFLFAILIVCLVKISAQIPKEIKGGVLNGKAITLVKPHYPAAARSVNASGSVSIQILIDELGNVVSVTSAITINPAQYSDERPKISAELIKMIEKRLEIAPSQLWKFKAETVFGKISEQSGDLEKIQTEASNLSKLIETAPNKISAVNLVNMGKLMMMIQSDNITEGRKAEIKSLENSLKIF